MYGILINGAANTGLDNELLCSFAAPLGIRSNTPSFVSNTINQKRISNKQTSQRWEITTNISASNDIKNYFVKSILVGDHTPFYVRMPQIINPTGMYTEDNSAGTQSMSVQVLTVAAIGASVVRINSGSLSVGEFVNFGTDLKVYSVISTTLVSTGVYDISIFPNLLLATQINAVVKFGSRATMYGIFDNNIISGVHYNDGILADCGSVTIFEYL